MHSWSLLSDGFFLSLSLCLDIGIANVAIISLALSHGFKPGFVLGLGTCFGDLFYAALALAGMSALLQFSAVRWVVWIGGAIVLLFLTWKMAREALYPASAPPVEGEADLTEPRPSHCEGFLRGALLAVSSPSGDSLVRGGRRRADRQGRRDEPDERAPCFSRLFLGGLGWTIFICTLASHGRKRAGTACCARAT